MADATTARRARRRRRLTRALQLVGILGVFGWFGYRQFVWTPPALPEPVSRSAAVEAGPDAWPIAGGDLGARRVSIAPAHLAGAVAWTRELGSSVTVPIVGDASALYVALADGRLLAISVEDGSELWSRQLLYALRFASPTVAAGRLYVALRDGRIQALDTASGAVLWDANLGTAYPATPLVSGGVVYAYVGLGTPDRSFRGAIFGLDAEDGAVLWREDVDTLYPLIPPVVDEEHLAVAAADRLLIFDRRTGVQTYWLPFSRRSHPTAVAIADGTVYGLSRRLLVAVDADTTVPWHYAFRGAWLRLWAWDLAPRPPAPETRWVVAAPPRDAFPPVVLSDRLIVAGSAGELRGYALQTGEQLWSAELGPLVGPPVLTADGLLLLHDDALVLVDATDGSELGRRSFPAGGLRDAVVTSHGTYLVGEGGTLVALR